MVYGMVCKVWFGMVWYDVVWCDVVWFGMVWCAENIVSFTGGIDVLINGTTYSNYSSLTNQSVEAGVGLLLSKPEAGCLEVSYPSGAGGKFCEKNNMLSIIVTTVQAFFNKTKGLLGTYNGDTADDFTLPDGTVYHPVNNSDLHYNFGLRCK